MILLFPTKWTRLDIQPYISDEIFVDLNESKLNCNRLYVGFKTKLIKHLEADIFYLWQTTKNERDWTDYNIIATKIKIKF